MTSNTDSVERVEPPETGNQWIPITERKPTAWDSDKIGRVLYRDSENRTWSCAWNSDREVECGATHWCRIPIFKEEDSASPETPTQQTKSPVTDERPRADSEELKETATKLCNYLENTPVKGFDVPDEIWLPFTKALDAPQPSGTREGREDSGVEAPTPRPDSTLHGQATISDTERVDFLSSQFNDPDWFRFDWYWFRKHLERGFRSAVDYEILASQGAQSSDATQPEDKHSHKWMFMGEVNQQGLMMCPCGTKWFIPRYVAPGSEAPTPQASTDDVREQKIKDYELFKRSALISALRKVAPRCSNFEIHAAFQLLANELEKSL